ncbi:tRNA (guanine-N(7)-)-methyltransferase non-catalytic subunit TRM82 [Frankliniella fusca]|uniref:tRNA (Guanine-N(7)-)-methyltransferase non-catalytic subunit TRM82 n=1 Tax=Frankliniella fusca TaxID=407009 RepID=A0AAE1H5Q1_9NEOP|nr:tRNA (guanine-N(7)-)-methyltransferase non-catalytic subunit TRM82 [Frankliniella fusca]
MQFPPNILTDTHPFAPFLQGIILNTKHISFASIIIAASCGCVISPMSKQNTRYTYITLQLNFSDSN